MQDGDDEAKIEDKNEHSRGEGPGFLVNPSKKMRFDGPEFQEILEELGVLAVASKDEEMMKMHADLQRRYLKHLKYQNSQHGPAAVTGGAEEAAEASTDIAQDEGEAHPGAESDKGAFPAYIYSLHKVLITGRCRRLGHGIRRRGYRRGCGCNDASSVSPYQPVVVNTGRLSAIRATKNHLVRASFRRVFQTLF